MNDIQEKLSICSAVMGITGDGRMLLPGDLKKAKTRCDPNQGKAVVKLNQFMFLKYCFIALLDIIVPITEISGQIFIYIWGFIYHHFN